MINNLFELYGLIISHLYLNRAIIIETECSSQELPFVLEKWRSNLEEIIAVINSLYGPQKSSLFRNLVKKHENMIYDMSVKYKYGCDITTDYQEFMESGRELAQVIKKIEPKVDITTITNFILKHHYLGYEQIIATMNGNTLESQKLFDLDEKNIKNTMKYLTPIFLDKIFLTNFS